VVSILMSHHTGTRIELIVKLQILRMFALKAIRIGLIFPLSRSSENGITRAKTWCYQMRWRRGAWLQQAGD